jgi:hypothetical protein
MILEKLKVDKIIRNYLYEKVNAIYTNDDKTINIFNIKNSNDVV